MKKRSLVAAFTLAAATFVTAGAANAQSISIPDTPGNNQVWSEQAPVQATAAPVSQAAIDDLTYNVGVQTPYYRTGVGFTQGTTTTGESVGIEYRLNGNSATPIKAYNLNDPASRQMFQQEVNIAYSREQNLANQEMYSAASYNYYPPTSYVICAPPVAIVPFGFVIGGWYAGYTPLWLTPAWRPWGGFWEGGHWDRDRGHWEGGRRIENRTTIINNNNVYERGGNHGGQWAGGNRGGQWTGGSRGGQWTGGGARTGAVPTRQFNNVAPHTTYQAPRNFGTPNAGIPAYHAPATNTHIASGNFGGGGGFRGGAAGGFHGGAAGGFHGGGHR